MSALTGWTRVRAGFQRHECGAVVIRNIGMPQNWTSILSNGVTCDDHGSVQSAMRHVADQDPSSLIAFINEQSNAAGQLRHSEG